MNATMKAYQAMSRAAADVAAGKKGAAARLRAAKTRYLKLVAATAKKEADAKVSASKKKAAAIGKIKKKSTAKAKTKKKVGTKKKTATKRRTR